ncbi:hypothetical protein [Rothia aerolata]|uniref:Uncharacterized protein n=1 Tax=Rothia aerolata TaxID=1812262 RepID=A0A917IMA7_9MICC|nr:hypothetical protein [Rothia aerolata]GGH57397.1 hypothetical protein GCM10007359_02480 [Rothia aerolata]
MTDSLASVTRFPGPYRVQADAILDVADTGERPLLVLASDGSDYWCKDFENRGNRETPINEIVSIEVGKAIGAPVCDWAIVDPPADMAGTRMGQTIVPRLPMFGSKEVKNVLLPENGIEYITKDDNFQRIPKLVALWLLCNAEDIQIMYAASEDHSIYSLDQGYWFGSHEMGRHFRKFFNHLAVRFYQLSLAGYLQNIGKQQ